MRRILGAVLSPFAKTTGLARWILVAGVLITAFFVVLAIFAPWIAPYGFAQASAHGVAFPKLAPPGHGHLFGTNNLEFDVLSRTIWGARTALEVVLLSVVVSLVIGVPLGLISGYSGGWLDRGITLVMDAIYTFPSLLLAIVFAFLLTNLVGGGVVSAAMSLTVIYIPQYFRVVRNTTISAKEETYVEAARAIGASDGVVMRRYLFGNVVQSVPVIGTLNAADAISTLAGLGFLGLGLQPNQAAEWGYDLSRAILDASSGVWWTGLYPGLAIVCLVTGLTLIGEGLNETVNPILRRRRLLPVVLPPRVRRPSAVVTEASPEVGMPAAEGEL
ncbi:MAG TPA: ABC transporter permease [Nocardioidaceae bacterium]|nr:ABC transporter permease [Nocardioidaceae bacterium]